MRRLRTVIFAVALLAGCATPIPKSETIPAFSGKPAATIAIAVVDYRPFILDGNKEEWFEGIFRGAFGIPHSLKRPGESEGKPFATYLASMLQDSLKNAGSKATVVEVFKGTALPKVINEVTSTKADAGLVVGMFQSRYDIGPANPEYAYKFDLIVLDKEGKKLANKTFQAMETGIELSDKYTLFDMMTGIYKQKFESFLNDPQIKNALTTADTH